MIKKFLRPGIGLLILSAAILSCSPQLVENLPTTDIARGLDDPTEESPATLAPETETSVPEPTRFSIQAATENQPPITALYAALFQGELPEFVDTGGDLIITQAGASRGVHPEIPATFLPDTILIPQINSAAVQNLINFSISLEGQAVLVENGFLPASVTLTDQAGNSLEINQPVMSVISTYGPATAFIYSVNAENRLVSASYLGARDPLGAAVMEKIDPRFPEIMGDEFFTQEDFNIEQAATLDPDLIVTSARTGWLDTVEELDLSVFLFDAETPDRLREAMRLSGQLFGPQSTAQAEVWVAYYDSILNSIREQTALLSDDGRPRVLFTGTVPTRVASGDMYQTDIIEAAGGKSVSEELTGYWNDVNLEQILIWDPDVIIVPPYGGASVSAITDSAEWQILDAVQAGRVYQMPKLVVPWDTPAPDSVLGIVWMAQRLHPNLSGLECGTEAEYFFNTFYNYPITEDEIESICSFE